MTYVLEIKEEATTEVIQAYLYYENKQVGLGETFLTHLDTYFHRIQANPNHFPQKRKPYHEVFIKRFPFIIIYEVEKTKIIIYAVFNTWQNPIKKKRNI